MEGTKEQQVQQLQEEYQRKLAEIQKAAESSPVSPEAAPATPEHQAVSKVTEKAIQEHNPEFQASSHEPGHTSNPAPEAAAQIEAWVQAALQDPYQTIKAAADTKDNALIDELHGALTGNEKWQQLVKEGKIPQL